ncbi:dihydroorotate dehydrogenase [Oceanobacillus halophilus]|uniref:Dihydroorotate dehydrogenase n=1 Tax=Oceanobacillus halophilus TaxID=930130 RepID=A0A495A3J2_9BACI|nr:dihydroorotate dehydrogenase [Oceanobacillus halophilus]RKQ32689.1 dihydroorotate dehydrogenase [Oceanobacillus halophilus]
MPDWSYHPLKKAILNRMSPKASREFIHKSMSSIASIPGGRGLIGFLGHMSPPHEIKKDINNLEFSSPIGLSSMIDPKLSGTNAFQELGFGFLEIGPIVLNEPQEAKEPRMKNNHFLFSEQQEKVPLKLAIKKLTSLNIRIPIVAQIDNQVNRNEWEIIVQHLTPFVDGFIGTKEQVHAFVDNSTLTLERTFYVSINANEVSPKALELENLTAIPGFGGIVINAPRQTVDNYWYEIENANEYIANTVQQVKNLFPNLVVITSGGVETPEDARSLVYAGADLLMLTDGYVKAGPGLPKRIHERLLYEESQTIRKQNWHWSFLFGLSILIGGLIALYFAFTSIILPYDETFIGLTRGEILQINPLILSFMSHDRMALAGTMISGGILYIQLARHGIKYGLHWTRISFHSAAIVGFLGIFLFIGYGYFDWLHGLFWLILLPIYILSFREGKRAVRTPISIHGKNDRAWKYGLYGQLMFIILGFLIIIGGVVISTIGVFNVFVSTDLSFLCMTPEMLDNISNNLIPVIAHDRAGFGSALISVGLLVLTISLWGFRKGERWIWNTICIGALPAFTAGIGTHIYIGYTTFIHLLPVYFLVILYLLGLILSYPFLKTDKEASFTE